MTLSKPTLSTLSATLLLLSGVLLSMPASAQLSPLEELKQAGFYGRVHAWNKIVRKAHNIEVKVPRRAPIIISDYHSTVSANGFGRSGTHNGVDIFGEIGSPIIAAADGYVVKAKVDRCWGPTILMSHGIDERGKAIYALYGHVKNFKVKVGQRVARGQQIAEMGDDIYTGCGAGFHHLHFQISYNPQEIPLFGWGWSSFVSDGKKAPNPHKFWADGEGKITCFEEGRQYPRLGFTYPVPCKGSPKPKNKAVTIIAKKPIEKILHRTAPKPKPQVVVIRALKQDYISTPDVYAKEQQSMQGDWLEREFISAAKAHNLVVE